MVSKVIGFAAVKLLRCLVFIHKRVADCVTVCQYVYFFHFQCSGLALQLTCIGVLQDSNINPDRKICRQHLASERHCSPSDGGWRWAASKRRGCDSSVADSSFMFALLIKTLLRVSQQLSPSETSFNSTDAGWQFTLANHLGFFCLEVQWWPSDMYTVM